MKLEPKALAPLLALVVGLLCTTALVLVQPKPEPRVVSEAQPLVRVLTVQPGTAQPWIEAAGTVSPSLEGDLVAEVAGRVVWMSPKLEAGARFEAGEVLLKIEPRDHAVAVERAAAALERAESQLGLARASLERSGALRTRGASSAARYEEAESNARIAAANVRDAGAQHTQAELDLSRTEVKAPFSGRVHTRVVDAGAFVGRGTPLARIFSAEAAEVRLPIAADDIAFLPESVEEATRSPEGQALTALGLPALPERGPQVILRSASQGADAEWVGQLVRTEGVLDDKTRMLHVVARISNPGSSDGGAPLTMGAYVEARIEGRPHENTFEVPRSALRPGNELLILDADSRLRRRVVTVLRSERDVAWVSSGLEAGERVCTTPPPVFVEGMAVRVADGEASKDGNPS